jgi:hypothetical protein
VACQGVANVRIHDERSVAGLDLVPHSGHQAQGPCQPPPQSGNMVFMAGIEGHREGRLLERMVRGWAFLLVSLLLVGCRFDVTGIPGGQVAPHDQGVAESLAPTTDAATPAGNDAPADAPVDDGTPDAAVDDASNVDAADAECTGTSTPCPCDPNGPWEPAVALPVTNEGVTINAVNINSGSNVAEVVAGAQLTVSISYLVTNGGCPSCRYQIDVGYVAMDTFEYCAYDDKPGGATQIGTDPAHPLTAPSQPGRYDIGFTRGEEASCPGQGNPWDKTQVTRIASVCVY